MNLSRRAALTLHSLDPADQHWVLSQLSPEHREVLLPLVGELKELGIPPDRKIASGALLPTPALAAELTPEDRVDAARVETMRELLNEEPDWAIRSVLALRDWSWRDKFLAGLATNRRRELAGVGASKPIVPKRLRQALIAAMVTRLDEAERATGQASRKHERRPVSRVLERVRRAVAIWKQ